jgi:hypothetical protein
LITDLCLTLFGSMKNASTSAECAARSVRLGRRPRERRCKDRFLRKSVAAERLPNLSDAGRIGRVTTSSYSAAMNSSTRALGVCHNLNEHTEGSDTVASAWALLDLDLELSGGAA